MEKHVLKLLTDTAYILMSNGERVALVSKNNNGHFVLTGKVSGHFKSFAELQEKFGKIDFEAAHEPTVEPEQGKIEQYPIKHSTWYNVISKPVPNYTRTETGNVRYAAGYYVIKFPNGWTQSFCPKLSTIEEYEYLGPFTNKIEAQQKMSSNNKLPDFMRNNK